MTCDINDFALWAGKTFSKTVRWEALPYVYKAITAITQAAPVAITAVGHGLTTGWRAAVISPVGMRQIKATNFPPQDTDFEKVTVTSADVVTFNEVNSTDYDVYTSGGYLVYLTPVSLAGFTARLKIKDRVGGTTLLSLTESAGITIDDTAKTITIVITAAQTALMTWSEGVYELEMISGAGVVTALLAGNVTVREEVTI